MNSLLVFDYLMHIGILFLIIALIISFYIPYKQNKYKKKCIKENNIHGDITYTEYKTIDKITYSATVKIYYGKLIEGTYNVIIYGNNQKSGLNTLISVSKCSNLDKLKTLAENAVREKIHQLEVERSRIEKVIEVNKLF